MIDDPGNHKARAIGERVRKAGARVWFLPTCSPDLRQIEQVFVKFRHLIGNTQKGGCERVSDLIGPLLRTFSPEACGVSLGPGLASVQTDPALGAYAAGLDNG